MGTILFDFDFDFDFCTPRQFCMRFWGVFFGCTPGAVLGVPLGVVLGVPPDLVLIIFGVPLFLAFLAVGSSEDNRFEALSFRFKFFGFLGCAALAAGLAASRDSCLLLFWMDCSCVAAVCLVRLPFFVKTEGHTEHLKIVDFSSELATHLSTTSTAAVDRFDSVNNCWTEGLTFRTKSSTDYMNPLRSTAHTRLPIC